MFIRFNFLLLFIRASNDFRKSIELSSSISESSNVQLVFPGFYPISTQFKFYKNDKLLVI